MIKRKKSDPDSTLPVIHVQTLGQFSISIDGRSIINRDNITKKPWRVLEYLIVYRDRTISSIELIDLIWPDDHSPNPQGALKTLIFRSRQLLEPLCIPPQNLIAQKRKSYGWNTDYQVIVDTDEFEALCNKADLTNANNKRQLKLYLQALDLYKGDFLPNSLRGDWSISFRDRYHSLFLQTTRKAIELLLQEEDWNTIIYLCRKAVSIEPFDESFHYHLIYALYNIEEQNRALDHYRFATDLFYNERSIAPSERLKDLYKVIRNEKHGVTTDLSIIQDSMKEESDNKGAYYCEFSVLRDIYQLEQRIIDRTGDSIYLCLLTIYNTKGELPKSSVIVRAMDALNTAIAESLRKGDVYCRYSISQYMISLPTDSHDNGVAVMKRIVQTFKKQYSRRDLVIDFSLRAIAPR